MATRETSNGTRTTERWTNEGVAGYYTGQPLAKARDLTSDEAASLASIDASNIAATNQASIQTKARNALANNTAYVASTPTTAQALAQVKVLTQQNNALIRLLLQEFDTDS